MLDKKKILAKLEEREAALRDRSERDFSGGFDSSHIGRLKELQYWIGAIKRNEFDVKVWDD